MEIGRGNGHGVVPMSGQWQPFNRQEHAIHRPEPEPKTTRNCLDVRRQRKGEVNVHEGR